MRKLILALTLPALCTALPALADTQVFHFTEEGMGGSMQIDTAGGVSSVKINTYQTYGNFSNCEYDSGEEFCTQDGNSLVCPTEEGMNPIIIKLAQDGSRAEVSGFPGEYCGMGAYADGPWAAGPEPGSEGGSADDAQNTNADVYEIRDGSIEGMLTMEIGEEMDAYITINTVNVNNLAICEFDSVDYGPCYLNFGANESLNVTCHLDGDETVDMIINNDGKTLEVTNFPADLCGRNGSALGTYHIK